MQIYCPKCRQLTTSTFHRYHNTEGQVIRIEEVCDKCHCTIRIEHYSPEVKPELKIDEKPNFSLSQLTDALRFMLIRRMERQKIPEDESDKT
jgi:transcriptional regulator NrdR family protein